MRQETANDGDGEQWKKMKTADRIRVPAQHSTGLDPWGEGGNTAFPGYPGGRIFESPPGKLSPREKLEAENDRARTSLHIFSHLGKEEFYRNS